MMLGSHRLVFFACSLSIAPSAAVPPTSPTIYESRG